MFYIAGNTWLWWYTTEQKATDTHNSHCFGFQGLVVSRATKCILTRSEPMEWMRGTRCIHIHMTSTLSIHSHPHKTQALTTHSLPSQQWQLDSLLHVGFESSDSDKSSCSAFYISRLSWRCWRCWVSYDEISGIDMLTVVVPLARQLACSNLRRRWWLTVIVM